MNDAKIKLTEDLYLGGYKYGFVIIKKHINQKTHEPVYKEVAYFSRLDHVFSYLVRNVIKADITILNNLERTIALSKVFTDLWNDIKDDIKLLFTN
jgi:2-phosphoglycerate kinase